jgi:hypothetical protein
MQIKPVGSYTISEISTLPLTGKIPAKNFLFPEKLSATALHL